jgi:hypothetical protein
MLISLTCACAYKGDRQQNENENDVVYATNTRRLKSNVCVYEQKKE